MAPKTVLLIDPDHDSRVAVRAALESAGHFVVSTTSGADALLMLEKTSVPAIVYVSTDVLMLSGEHFLTLFHAQEKYAGVPAVQLRHAGASDLPNICCFVNAPFKSDDVLSCLKHCF